MKRASTANQWEEPGKKREKIYLWHPEENNFSKIKGVSTSRETFIHYNHHSQFQFSIHPHGLPNNPQWYTKIDDMYENEFFISKEHPLKFEFSPTTCNLSNMTCRQITVDTDDTGNNTDPGPVRHTEIQKEIVMTILEKQNTEIFEDYCRLFYLCGIVGSAGTGKSTTLKLLTKFEPLSFVYITAQNSLLSAMDFEKKFTLAKFTVKLAKLSFNKYTALSRFLTMSKVHDYQALFKTFEPQYHFFLSLWRKNSSHKLSDVCTICINEFSLNEFNFTLFIINLLKHMFRVSFPKGGVENKYLILLICGDAKQIQPVFIAKFEQKIKGNFKDFKELQSYWPECQGNY